jgi:hypothetical protein
MEHYKRKQINIKNNVEVRNIQTYGVNVAFKRKFNQKMNYPLRA